MYNCKYSFRIGYYYILTNNKFTTFNINSIHLYQWHTYEFVSYGISRQWNDSKLQVV